MNTAEALHIALQWWGTYAKHTGKASERERAEMDDCYAALEAGNTPCVWKRRRMTAWIRGSCGFEWGISRYRGKDFTHCPKCGREIQEAEG